MAAPIALVKVGGDVVEDAEHLAGLADNLVALLAASDPAVVELWIVDLGFATVVGKTGAHCGQIPRQEQDLPGGVLAHCGPPFRGDGESGRQERKGPICLRVGVWQLSMPARQRLEAGVQALPQAQTPTDRDYLSEGRARGRARPYGFGQRSGGQPGQRCAAEQGGSRQTKAEAAQQILGLRQMEPPTR